MQKFSSNINFQAGAKSVSSRDSAWSDTFFFVATLNFVYHSFIFEPASMMCQNGGVLLVFLALIAATVSLKLPSYITSCKRNDPKLDQCIVEHGQAVLERFSQGEPKYGIPRMDPMDITELKVTQGSAQVGLELTLKNIKMYGMKHAKFLSSKTNLAKRNAVWKFAHERVEMIGDYSVNGKILVLPIRGEGKCNITITDVKVDFEMNWNLIKKDNGKEYINFTNTDLKLSNGRAYFKLENLFGGDRTLGDNMNAFLNENWKEVTQDVGPALGKAMGDVFTLLVSNLNNVVSYDNIYPPS
ncbi:hypothetical protein LSTR_LSTR012326 [Laodelphax striatellus]|uniref:Protein takeout n=1 Tax=Laodelphax striatellus TaxID=195883 RepID=A0A482WSU8_LAOST|nr:hypothetical protein LSTR_LSTR012326 [Laodelphax striatellus]